MACWNYIAVMAATLITFLSMAEGFFLYSNNNKKTNPELESRPMIPDFVEEYDLNCQTAPFQVADSRDPSTDRQFPPPQTNFYRDIGPAQQNSWGAQYAFDGSGPVTVALPVAVPIQAQMAPVPPSLKGTVHNVQLVPCLCPVSKDVDSPYLSSPSAQQAQQIQQSPSAYIVQSAQSAPQST